VSQSFEQPEGKAGQGERWQPVPILGMQRYFDAYAPGLKNTTVHVSPGPTSASSTHGGFDDDALSQRRVIEFIHKR
jgi:hypothetical protein